MMKTLMNGMFTFCLALLLCISAQAETVVANGTCGDPNVNDGKNVIWNLDSDGLLTISGTGEMVNNRLLPWANWRMDIKRVVIQNGVTSIGEGAFNRCWSLTSVTIPDSVTSVGQDAFHGCSKLRTAGHIGSNCNIEFGWSNSIPDRAFYGSDKLENVTIPDGIEHIGMCAFAICQSLKYISFPDSATDIGASSFEYCTSLHSIQIPEKVKTIGAYMFYRSALQSIILPEGLESIEGHAFNECALEQVKIPDSVKTIGKEAFRSCTALTNVTIGNGVKNIGEYAFGGCTSLVHLVIPDSVEIMGEGVFDFCSSLANVKVGKGLLRIAKRAFRACSSLNSIEIPDSIKSVGEDAFDGCSQLKRVLYTGDETMWKNIIIDDGNNALLNSIRYAISFDASGKIVATITNPAESNEVLIVAGYDSAGKQSCIKTILIEKYKTIYETGVVKQSNHFYKIMIVDASTYAPLCVAWNSR